MRTDMLTIHARAKLGTGSDWSVFKYRCLPEGGPETQVYELIGGVEVTGSRGKTSWSKPYLTAYVTPAEHAAFCASWEIETGLCSDCQGTREVFAGWSKATGTRKRPCTRCKGTGKRAEAQSA